MEPVRPLVDSYVLDWMIRVSLRREWFFEKASGNCRLMGAFAAQLAETAMTWRKAVAPYAEQAARIFWQSRAKKSRFALPTRLTQVRRSLAKDGNLATSVPVLPQTRPRCRSSSHNRFNLLREMCARCESRKSIETSDARSHRDAQRNSRGSQGRYTREARRSVAQMESFRPAEVARRRNVQACDFAASREIHSEGDSPEARRISSLRNVN